MTPIRASRQYDSRVWRSWPEASRTVTYNSSGSSLWIFTTVAIVSTPFFVTKTCVGPKMKESFYRDGTWFFASAMVHKRLAEIRHDEHLEHALLAVRHTLTAMGKGHNRAAFDSGVMAEEGFGTPPHIVNAYVAYILGCMARDERAIAKVRDCSASSNALRNHFELQHQSCTKHGRVLLDTRLHVHANHVR